MTELEHLLGEAVTNPVRPAGPVKDYVWPPAGYRPFNLPPIPSMDVKPQPMTVIPPHLAERVGDVLAPLPARRLLDLPVVPGRRVEPKGDAPRPPRPELDPQPVTTKGDMALGPWQQSANVMRARRLLADPDRALPRLLRLLRGAPSRTWTTDELAAAVGMVRYGVSRTLQTLTRSEVCQALHPARDRGWVVMERINPDQRDLGIRWTGVLTEEIWP